MDCGSIRRSGQMKVLWKSIVALGLGVAWFAGWQASAQTSIKAVAVNDPLAKLSRRMDAMEKSMQARIDLLELRVRKLEQKPDSPDDDKSSGHEKPNSGSSAASSAGAPPNAPASTPTSSTSQAVFNLIQRVTALEHRTVVRAPFIVDDSAGHALLSIQEKGGADAVRGVRIFNDEGQPLITFDASGIGGKVKVMLGSSEETYAALGALVEGPQLQFYRDGKGLIRLWTTESGNGLYVNDLSGHVVAAVMTVEGTRGQVGVFNGDKSIGVIAQGQNGGELELNDLAGVPMVQAGTLPTHVGIVRTGPASRAPGGLMGVPGSYITGKGN